MGEVGKLRTARDRGTSQILGPRPAEVPLASGEVTSDDDNDLDIALRHGYSDISSDHGSLLSIQLLSVCYSGLS